VIYLLDNSISFRFAHMLVALGVDVLAVRDVEELGAGAGDVEIVQWLRGRERTFITADKHIRTRPAEIAALKESRVTALFLERFWSKLEFWPQAAWLITRWPEIDRWASSVPAGSCAAVQQRGRIQLL
jgi:hypothetical protein